MAKVTKVRDIIEQISQGLLPAVRFNREIEEFETYFDENMVARAVAYEPPEDGLVRIWFHTQQFDAHNTMVEKPNYWSEDKLVSSREADMHPEKFGWKESVYLDPDSDFPGNMLTIASYGVQCYDDITRSSH